MGYLDQNLHNYLLKQCPANALHNGDEGLPRISFAGRGLLVKMLIIVEPHGIFNHIMHINTL